MFDNKISVRNPGQLIRHGFRRTKERGTLYLVWMGIKIFFYLPMSWLFYTLKKSDETFEFGGAEYNYDLSWYNMTWLNERTIEIPIARKMVDEGKGAKLLEVGNVLCHYGIHGHTVVDLYEKALGVINCDIVNYEPNGLFDFIITISTLEHVGWDELPREPEKVLIAIEKLIKLLKKDGIMFFTIPLGINEYLDKAIIGNQIKTTSSYLFKKERFLNRWVELKDIKVKDIYMEIVNKSGAYLFVGLIRR